MGLTPQTIGGLHPELSAQQRADIARDAALDLYLMLLAQQGVFERAGVVFKGGTAVRKFHCPPAHYHRISHDLDFALVKEPDRDKLTRLMSTQEILSGLGL